MAYETPLTGLLDDGDGGHPARVRPGMVGYVMIPTLPSEAVCVAAYAEMKGDIQQALDYLGVQNTHRAFAVGYNDVDNPDYHYTFEADSLTAFFEDTALLPEDYELLGAGCFSLCFRVPCLGSDFVLKVSLIAYDVGPAYWAYCREHYGEKHVPLVVSSGRDEETGWRWCVMEYCDELPLDVSMKFREALFKDGSPILDWAHRQGTVDLHGGNIMRTLGGSVVITDPVSLTKTDMKRIWGRPCDTSTIRT